MKNPKRNRMILCIAVVAGVFIVFVSRTPGSNTEPKSAAYQSGQTTGICFRNALKAMVLYRP